MAIVDAVLFDLDGVLVDTREAWFDVLTAAARTLGYPAPPRARFDATWGQGVVDDVREFYPGSSVTELERVYARHYPDALAHLIVDPDAVTLLAALRALEIRTAVITNSPAPLARATLARAGIEPDALVTASDVARPKPAPDMILRACELLGIAPSGALVVGDTRFDREAAARASVRFAGLRIDGDLRLERLGALGEALALA